MNYEGPVNILVVGYIEVVRSFWMGPTGLSERDRGGEVKLMQMSSTQGCHTRPSSVHPSLFRTSVVRMMPFMLGIARCIGEVSWADICVYMNGCVCMCMCI